MIAAPAPWLAAVLAGILIAGPALAEPRPQPRPRAARPVAPQAVPRPLRAAGGRALLLAHLAGPEAQTTPLPQPVPMSPQALSDPKPVDRWWFWATAGGLVLATAALFLVATSGSDRPGTKLGNMEAFH